MDPTPTPADSNPFGAPGTRRPAVAGVASLLVGSGEGRTAGARESVLFGSGVAAPVSGAPGALGVGLNRLRPWSRWPAPVPVIFAVFVNLLAPIFALMADVELVNKKVLRLV